MVVLFYRAILSRLHVPNMHTLSDQSVVVVTPTGPVLIPARVRQGLAKTALMPGASWCCSPEEMLEEMARALQQLPGLGIYQTTAFRPLGTTGLMSLAAIDEAGAHGAVRPIPVTEGSRGMEARREGLFLLHVDQLTASQREALRETPTADLTIGLRVGIPRTMDRSPDGMTTRQQWAEAQRLDPLLIPDAGAARVVMMAHVGQPAPRVLRDALYRKPRAALSAHDKATRDREEPISRTFWQSHALLSESLAPWAPALHDVAVEAEERSTPPGLRR